MQDVRIIDTNMENIREFGICGYKNPKRPGYPEKLDWLQAQFQEGLKIKTLYSEQGGAQGMIEYLPGEYCWRPVKAEGYIFIHCLYAGFRKEYQRKGYGSLMLKECLQDAKKQNLKGVAAVTRKGSFMGNSTIFLKNGFKAVDQANPDFELVVKKFDESHPSPKFKNNQKELTGTYGKGLFILRADQCPYTVKNVNEICETAKTEFNISPKIVNLKNHQQAQNNPCPFGTFGIILNGKIISHHPISSRRFENIMKKRQ